MLKLTKPASSTRILKYRKLFFAYWVRTVTTALTWKLRVLKLTNLVFEKPGNWMFLYSVSAITATVNINRPELASSGNRKACELSARNKEKILLSCYDFYYGKKCWLDKRWKKNYLEILHGRKRSKWTSNLSVSFVQYHCLGRPQLFSNRKLKAF